MKDQSMESFLLFAQNALANAANVTEIKSALALYGYDDAKVLEGQTLYESASALHDAQKKEYGEQYAATDALMAAKAAANEVYMVHVHIARVALKNDRSAGESLQLTGRRKRSLSGWMKQAKTLYANSLNTPDVITALGSFGIDQTKLEGGQTLVSDVETKLNAQLKEKGEAQAATEERDEAFDTLDDWMDDFITIARIALMHKPQYLEMLGIVERS